MKRIYTFLIIAILSVAGIYAQNVEVTPVDFNSRDDDFGSSLAQQNRYMYFTSERSRGRQKAFVVEKTSGGWATPEQLDDEINDASQSGAMTVTPDGQYMIFAAYEHSIRGSGRTDLYSARRVNGKWTDIQNLGPDINSDAWDSQPCLSSDGRTLYFVSDRDGTRGGTDIYMSTRTTSGWSRAVNLGAVINTGDDEMSPVIAADGKTLYFASNRNGGYGGFDIYVTKYTGSNWQVPKNAGQPINSAADEFYYTSVPNSNIAYLSSDREGGNGGLDIYMAVPNPFPSEAVVLVHGTVRDVENNNPLGSDITVTDLKSGKKVGNLRSDDISGDYNVVLQSGRIYSVTSSRKGYLFYSERFEVPPAEKGRDVTKDIYLSPLERGNTRLLVFFDFDKTDLKDESIPELERIVEFMRDNPGVKIELDGHTDDVGSDDYNDKLSNDRAISVKNYLVNSGGIDKSRIRTKGYGKRKPLVKDKSDEARAQNRRVEMVVVQ